MVQTNMSLTRRAGTLRGMHYQSALRTPRTNWCDAFRVRSGTAIVDIRPGSPTYCKWIGVELSESNARMLLVPKGFAHGFLTLTDDAQVVYQVSEFYAPGCEQGASLR